MVSSTPAQTTFRAAISAHLSEQNTRPLLEALHTYAQSSAHTPTMHALNRRLIEALKKSSDGSQWDHAFTTSPAFLNILGRFDQLLGQHAAAQTHNEKHRIDEKAQRLITEFEAIDSHKHHPISLSGSDDAIKTSHPIDQHLLAPWPVSPHQKDHWVFEFGPDLAIALPTTEAKALLDPPALTAITAKEKNAEGEQSSPKVWGFSGIEWANAPLPVVALTQPQAYRRALGICVCVLQTPREVASDFSHFGLLCPSLPRAVSKEDITQNHHQFIDWVAVVRAIKKRF